MHTFLAPVMGKIGIVFENFCYSQKIVTEIFTHKKKIVAYNAKYISVLNNPKLVDKPQKSQKSIIHESDYLNVSSC